MTEITGIIISASGVVTVIVGIAFFSWFKILKETNVLLKDQNEELKIANKELLLRHNENLVQLASLQGQIDTIKSIPLANIDQTLKQIIKFNKSQSVTNRAILKNLEASATVLARNTENAAGEARLVRADLVESNR